MSFMTFGDTGIPMRVAILLPDTQFSRIDIEKYYIQTLKDLGVDVKKVMAIDLPTKAGKTSVTQCVKPALDNLKDRIQNLGVEYLVVCNAQYFKTLTKNTQAEKFIGESVPAKYWELPPEREVKVIYAPTYKQAAYNNQALDKIHMSLEYIATDIKGGSTVYSDFSSRMHYWNASSEEASKTAFDQLMNEPALTIDIETTGLSLEDDIRTIAFSRNDNSGIGMFWRTSPIWRKNLRNFLKTYKGKKIYHGGTFDTKQLIDKLFMNDPEDYIGMLEGLHCLWKNAEDTKAMAFVLHNTCEDLDLSLKALGKPYAGNWGLDFKEKISDIKLLEYNQEDTAVTKWLFDQLEPDLQASGMRKAYEKVLIPSLKTITLMELVGMPLNMGQVYVTETELTALYYAHLDKISQHPLILSFNDELREEAANKANQTLKKLRKTAEDFQSLYFNPNSGKQLGKLFHDYIGLPILSETATGQPSTSASALDELIDFCNQHSLDPEYKSLLLHIKELHEIGKILNTFIKAFCNHSLEREGWHFLHGNFNLPGAKSYRLTSSGPNLQNLPSTGTVYAKSIKKCFSAPKKAAHHDHGWLFVGADYSSLEDRISALLTKDPNKLAVYTHGYDGHCLRAYAYFKDQMPDITAELKKHPEHSEEYVRIINSIETRYPKLRQHSKGPTFALTYGGTEFTLRKNFGIPQEEAIQIEKSYHELYAVSDNWVKARIEEAKIKGYVELAFGFRLHTPILRTLMPSQTKIPYQAEKEAKTAGNALGQSYGLLNSYSANLFMERVWASEWATKIFPVAQIHDSQYYMIANHIGCLKWVNDNLMECMEWNDLPAIKHAEVGLSAQLEVYYPSWADPIKIPNRATAEEILTITGSAGTPEVK